MALSGEYRPVKVLSPPATAKLQNFIASAVSSGESIQRGYFGDSPRARAVEPADIAVVAAP
jgi:hypothetical protein